MHINRRSLAGTQVLAATLLLAVSCGEGTEPGEPTEPQVSQAPQGWQDDIDGMRVATVALSSSHSVEFWQLGDGAIHMREVGVLEDLGEAIDYEALSRLSPAERFLQLAGPGASVPSALLTASVRSAQRAASEPLVQPALVPPPEAKELMDGALAPVLAPYGHEGSRLRSQGVMPLWDWTADAQWWQSNFCALTSVDHAWCPTNVAWADAGSVWAMYYETSCLAASFDQSATHNLRQWNGSQWVLLASTTLAPRYWQKWWMETSSWYTSRCETINSGGDPRVHFAHRVRWATPSTTALADHPFDREYGSDLSDDIQGVTHDAGNWYAANAEYVWSPWSGTTIYSHIWKTPVGTDVNNTPSPFYGNPWHGTYNHFGDISYGAGYVFVALEAGGGSGSRGAVGVFNTSLQVRGSQTLPAAAESDQGGSMPWVSYNPKDGLLYSSKFDASYINKYSWSVTYDTAWRLNLSFAGRIPLRDKYGNATSLSSLQGAEFSSTGKLYLSSDSAGGIYVVDPYNGRVQTFIPVQIDHSSGEELEGITLWDLDSGAAPNIRGQIHIQLLDNDDTSTDDLYFKHFRAAEPTKL
jgi:hypothetical protein